MAIFKLKNKNLTALKSQNFSSEEELRELVDPNLSVIFGLEFIGREFGGQGFRIDTIAYDPQAKSPVLIEYKRDTFESIVDQGLAYLHWFLTHKGDYQVALTEKLGRREIIWSQTRVIFIAKEFNTHQKWASSFKDTPFELHRYELTDGNFLLEPVEMPRSDISITSVLRTKETQKVVSQIKTFTLTDHLSKTNETIKALFEKLQKLILSLDEKIQEKPVKFYVGYKVRYWNFCTIHFYTQKLRIYVLTAKIDDPRKFFKMVPPEYKWSKTPLWYTDLTDEGGLNYIFGIIKQAYQSAPDL